MLEYRQSTQVFVPARLLDIAGAPVAGKTYSDVTAALMKADGTEEVIPLVGAADFVELSTGAWSANGAYRLRLSAAQTNTTGLLMYTVRCPGAVDYDGIVKIVAREEEDTFTRLGAPAGASIAADIAAIPAAISTASIADAVWDEAVADHLTPGSTGERLSNAGTGVSFFANGDTVNPIIFSVSSPKQTQVKVTFSEPVVMTAGANGALNPANYNIPGLTISAITSLTPQQVLITTSPQTPNFLYTLTIENVEDLAGNPI